MAEESYPFQDSPVATFLQWTRMMRMLLPDGIDSLPSGTSGRVTAGSGLNVNVAAIGGAWVRGVYYRSDAVIGKGLAAVPGGTTNPRIDRVVLRVNSTAQTATPTVITGTPAAAPVAPAMTYTETTFDLPLGRAVVNSNSTLGAITDERRFVGRPVVYCTSTNRPDPQGRPLLAFEEDTKRVVYTSGDGNWIVGMGADIFRPLYTYSGDNGQTTAVTSWDTTLLNTAVPSVSLSFVAPPSGRAFIHMGCALGSDGVDAAAYCALRLRDSTGADVWAFNTPTGTGAASPDRMIYNNSPGERGSQVSTSATWYIASLVPGRTYTCTQGYRVSSGTGTFDDRWIKVDPLP